MDVMRSPAKIMVHFMKPLFWGLQYTGGPGAKAPLFPDLYSTA
jgi:hypothetical protein